MLHKLAMSKKVFNACRIPGKLTRINEIPKNTNSLNRAKVGKVISDELATRSSWIIYAHAKRCHAFPLLPAFPCPFLGMLI